MNLNDLINFVKLELAKEETPLCGRTLILEASKTLSLLSKNSRDRADSAGHIYITLCQQIESYCQWLKGSGQSIPIQTNKIHTYVISEIQKRTGSSNPSKSSVTQINSFFHPGDGAALEEFMLFPKKAETLAVQLAFNMGFKPQ